MKSTLSSPATLPAHPIHTLPIPPTTSMMTMAMQMRVKGMTTVMVMVMVWQRV
jgi:hypothetical protein